MATLLNPYLNFPSGAKDALEFYRSVFGGELTTTTFGEGGMAQDPADQDKLMHGQLVTDAGLVLMASDAPSGMELSTGSSHSISLSGEDDAELRGYWDGLSDGATIGEPLTTAPWGDTFGMLTDKFGVPWMVNITATQG
ncbi:VOC family protein [Cellulomonas soli]|uniref:VOC family protein n=1 Tax=Cellulomonas soli TaxID=931535 RepID=UPI003F865403